MSNPLSPVAGSGPTLDEQPDGALSPEFAQLRHNHKIAILLVAAVIAAVEVSNRMSINVILPDMQGNVAADVDQISWVLILYNMGFICSIALTPWARRLFGARRHFTLSVLLYTMGALGCFLSAHDLTTLLISRTVMGLGGGSFLVRLVITAGLFFQGKARLVPLTWVNLVLFSMQIVYPTAMGAISDHLQWNYAFLLDIPILAAAILLLRALLPRGHVRRQPWRVASGDLWGASFLILALVALQLCASRGERDLWFESPLIADSFGVAILALHSLCGGIAAQAISPRCSICVMFSVWRPCAPRRSPPWSLEEVWVRGYTFSPNISGTFRTTAPRKRGSFFRYLASALASGASLCFGSWGRASGLACPPRSQCLCSWWLSGCSFIAGRLQPLLG